MERLNHFNVAHACHLNINIRDSKPRISCLSKNANEIANVDKRDESEKNGERRERENMKGMGHRRASVVKLN